MTVVKISKKDDLEILVGKLTLRLGRKPTQQEVIDTCVTLGIVHFDEIAARLVPGPTLNDEKVRKIKEMSEALSDAPWEDLDKDLFSNEEDSDIYS